MIVKRSHLLLPPSAALHIEQSTCIGETMITIVPLLMLKSMEVLLKRTMLILYAADYDDGDDEHAALNLVPKLNSRRASQQE